MALWSSQCRKSLPGGRNEEELAGNYFLGKGTVIETYLCNLLCCFISQTT